ncbi:hypothetical protein KUF84_08345 [Streptococcus equi subsp. zooepidemicus]|nr:hypothetical protein [Streptococcus equi subsp. zooepidemicus]
MMIDQAQSSSISPKNSVTHFFENERARAGKGRGNSTAHLRNQVFSDLPFLSIKVCLKVRD